MHKAQRPSGSLSLLGHAGADDIPSVAKRGFRARMVFVEGAAVKPAVSVITGEQGGHEGGVYARP